MHAQKYTETPRLGIKIFLFYTNSRKNWCRLKSCGKQEGDIDGAVQYWMKAKAKNVESETIDKKIAERKMYD